MSGKFRYLPLFLAALGLFVALGLVFDRSFYLYPFLQGERLKSEKEKIVASLQRYDAIFSDIYASGGGAKLLNEFPASKAMRHELFRDIGYNRDANRVQVYDLATLTPVDIRMTGYNTAEAVVFEEWNYTYQRKEDRRPLALIKGMGQGFKYRMLREGRGWIVTAWYPVTVEEPAVKNSVP